LAAIDAPTPLPQRMMPLGSGSAQRLADGFGVVGIVHWILAVSADVEDFVLVLHQKGFHLLLQLESSMI
jgi:hypothetical protein